MQQILHILLLEKSRFKYCFIAPLVLVFNEILLSKVILNKYLIKKNKKKKNKNKFDFNHN